MTVTINGSTGITTPEVTIDNTNADGGQVVLKSSGYSNWNIDNYSGTLRAYYNSTENFKIDSSGRVTIPNQPAFAVQGTGSGNKTGGTVIGFVDSGGSGQVNFNIGSCWSNANNRFTAPVDGVYAFNMAVYILNSSSVAESIAPCVNGGQLSTGDVFLSYDGNITSLDNQGKMSFILKLSANDYVDLRVRSGYPTINFYAGHSFFQGYLIR